MKLLKKLVYGFVASAIAMLGMTSCSQEDMPAIPNREGMVDVVMSTSLPQGLQTYGVNSAEGGLKNLEDKGYTVRYIMEIYPEGSTTKVQRMIKYEPITPGGTYRNTTFETRLLASKYKFVFFADIVRKVNNFPYGEQITGMAAPYYCNRYFYSNTDEESDVLIRPTYPTAVPTYVEGDLQNICASRAATDTEQNPYTEMYDAYSCTESVDLRNEPIQQEFVLKRPFAKLRLVTTDADQLLATPDWSKSRVDITTSDIPTGYNALTGESVNVSERGYWNGGSQALNSDVYSNETGTDKTIAVFYLPIPAKSQNLTFTINVKDASGKSLAQGIQLTVENVPLVGNKLTTIKGNLLSKNAVVNVRIDDEFEKDDKGKIDETVIEYGKEATTVDELKGKLSGGTEAIEYTGKVTKATGFTLDFSEIEAQPQTYSTATNPLFAEGNTAELTLKFSNVEENAVITFAGGINAPKKLRIVTETKCSLRIDLSSSDVYYDGSSYKYIVTNSRNYGQRTGLQYDAMFNAGGSSIFPAEYVNAHLFNINADFTLPENVTCTFVKKHQDKVCNFLHIVQTWLSSNSEKTVWNFVAEYEPTTTE